MGKHDAIQWNETLEKAVLNSIESGLSLRKAAEQNDMTSSSIIRRLSASESFAAQYTRAMEIRSELDFERLVDDLAEQPERTKFGIDPAWVQLKRLRVDTIKWALSKRVPKKYGDRVDHNVDGQIQVNFAAKSLLECNVDQSVNSGLKDLDAKNTGKYLPADVPQIEAKFTKE